MNQINHGDMERCPRQFRAPILPPSSSRQQEKTPPPGTVSRPESKTPEGIPASGADTAAALLYFLLGYGFTLLFFTGSFAVRTAVFTVCYAGAVLLYCVLNRRRPAGESWFWLVIMLSVGISFAFWSRFGFLQFLALTVTAAYWSLAVSGRLTDHGRTSAFLWADLLTALCLMPLQNLPAQYQVLGKRMGKDRKGVLLGHILLGLLLAVPLLLVILPLLSRADPAFEAMLSFFFDWITVNLQEVLLRLLFALPVSAFLFGLIYGGFYQDRLDNLRFRGDTLHRTAGKLRQLPNTIVCTALSLLLLFYLLFILLQGEYFFSAFAGIRPEQFSYAEYARRGFFELCQIGALNLCIFTGTNVLAESDRLHSRLLRIINILLAVVTILLIGCAMSKMVLYISVYHFTIKRIVTMVFMIWMLLVFGLAILWQKKPIPLVRWSVLSGAVLSALLCVLPLQIWTNGL